jgi:3-oxoacyl-[acyl-carrier-protein] synthase II
MDRRVAITGLGIASCLGLEVDVFWDALLAGRSGARVLELPGLPAVPACTVEDFAPEDRVARREVKRMDRVAQLAAFAAAAALEDAGDTGVEPARFGASIASAHGGAATLEDAARTLAERGLDRVSPFTIPLALTNAPVAGVARIHGLMGPTAAPATACAAGTDAIGFAYERIRFGYADAMVAGGSEAPIIPPIVAGYYRLGAIASLERGAEGASRPFDRARDGFVMAEGAAALVLEEWSRAEARGARIYAEVIGYGQSCDAGHLTSPDDTGAGPARAVTAALADAGTAADAVDYVNAHATSTPAGDSAEAAALERAGLGRTPVSSTKGQHGHTLAAAGAIEAVAAVGAFVRGVLPPSINVPDPDVGLDLVGRGREADPTVVVSTGFGFGGHDAAIVLRRP